MKSRCYIVFDDQGVVSMTKRKPKCSSGKFALALNLEVPDEFFNRNALSANVAISGGAVDPEVHVHVTDAYERVFGTGNP